MKSKQYFLKKAEENRPLLYKRKLNAQIDRVNASSGDCFLLDFGEHAVGHFSFSFDVTDKFIDAPVRLIIRFCEDRYEINADFSSYKGQLSNTWLQEETIILDYPTTVTLPRRYSCRYVKITVDSTRSPLTFYDFLFTATTSANRQNLVRCESADPLLRRIDEVAAKTLEECMQSFLEDGPKRDRRLWIGDLRLEALTNYYTFKNHDATRRSLYLIAAGECNYLGFLPSYVYETPYFTSGTDNLADYAMMFVISVCDYYEHTGDESTLEDFYELCKCQLDRFESILDSNLIVTRQDCWLAFIDWRPGLEKMTSLQGIYLYALERFIKVIDSRKDNDSERYRRLLKSVRQASRKHLYDEEKQLFINSLDHYNFSVHSQVFMILGGVIDGEDAKFALMQALESSEALHPFTPYMMHYVIEAMFKLGMKKEATAYIKNFWGGMLDRDADTFFEAYVPDDPDFSPYGDRLSNSLCHAWSCTPSYFIRKYSL